MFQTYVQSALAFSIKRGGILYGSKDEEGNVTVHAIYEPPQVGQTVTTSAVTAPPSSYPAHILPWHFLQKLLEHQGQLNLLPFQLTSASQAWVAFQEDAALGNMLCACYTCTIGHLHTLQPIGRLCCSVHCSASA